MSFDYLLFGAGHKGTLTTVDGDFVERGMTPIAEMNKKVPYEVLKHVVDVFTYAIAVHPVVNWTQEIIDGAVTILDMQSLD